MPLNLIFNANSPTQSQDGPLYAFDSQGNAQDQDFVFGDINLGVSLRPVVPSYAGSGRPWDDDFITGDTFQVAIGTADQPPASGDFPIGVFAGTIATSSVANPTVITTDDPHLLADGDTVIIVDHTGSTPSINGIHVATVTGANTFTIPVNVTVAGTGGTVYDAEGLDNISATITASAFESLLSAISNKHGYSTLEIELLATGVYQSTWALNGAVPSLYSPLTNDLVPDASVSILVDQAGDSDTQAIQIIALRQRPVAFSEPSTLFPVAAVTATVVQAGSASPAANKVYSISMTPGTYGGTYLITATIVGPVVKTVGVVDWSISAQDLLALLSSSTGLDEDQFEVTRENDILTVEFKDSQGNSNVPVIAVTNVNLLAPKGVSGLIQLNTTSLFRAFAATDAATLSYTLAVKRTRVSGEIAEIFQHVVTLKRSIINVLTMVPVLLPTYLTEAQADARYAKIFVAGVRELPDTGEIILYSPDDTGWSLSVDNDGLLLANPV